MRCSTLAKKSYATKTCHILCNQQIIDWRISYHGGHKVEHFVVMAMCVEELMDQMLNTCKKSCAITTWLILCNQHSFHWQIL
jgi:hypothetical protein